MELNYIWIEPNCKKESENQGNVNTYWLFDDIKGFFPIIINGIVVMVRDSR